MSEDKSDIHSDAALGVQALETVVKGSENHADVSKSIHSHGDHHKRHEWLEKLIPGLEKVTVKFHAGNFVAIRDRSLPPGSKKFFESMPIYARIGMHLLFYGKEQIKLLETHKLEKLFEEQTLKEGKIYNSPDSVKSIPSFVETYKLDLSELLQPDINKYGCFNEFFFRKLKPDARPVENSESNTICSAADSRLTVYETVSDAQKFWIKGDEFSVPRLLYEKEPDPGTFPHDQASLAIFRLAPADYHRFHSPVDATVVSEPFDIAGQYYTVNPQAVNEVDFDVFTANKRSVLYLKLDGSDIVVAFVAIGALLVGSIEWTKKAGETVRKGEELGYFAYGGSTIVAVFPQGLMKFSDDLLENSKAKLETYVKVGWEIGTIIRK